MKRLVRYALASACVQIPALAQPTTSTGIDTCSSANINVITHSLPQQCLRSNWTSSSPQYTSPPLDSSSSSLPPGKPSTPPASNAESVVVPSTGAQTVGLDSNNANQNPLSVGQEEVLTSQLSNFEGGATSSSAFAAPSVIDSPPDDEPDSFLDAAKFLSFEDWKKQKLGEAGNSAEALSRSRGETGRSSSRQRPGEGFDTLGEESEISLDFGGFASAIRPSPRDSEADQQPSGLHTDASAQNAPTLRLRSKDAGRTCKERFNYASFDCAATVLKTNSKCKSATSVLVENKDSYMLNECSTDNKFLIVELCEWVEIDTIVLANFEFFSSMFRTFRVSVSDRYPVKLDKWRVLGTFEARNTREIQAFLVENPMLWAKFLRIEFLTHYGNEFYCPLSLLRVHGTNMMEDFRRTNENDAQDEVEEGEIAVVPVVDQKSVSDPAASASDAIIQPIDVEIVSVRAEKPDTTSSTTEAPQTCAADVLSRRKSIDQCAATHAHTNESSMRLIPTPSTFAFTQDQSSESLQSTVSAAASTSTPVLTTSPSLTASATDGTIAYTTPGPSSIPAPSSSETSRASASPFSSDASEGTEAAPAATSVPPETPMNATSSSNEAVKTTTTSSSQHQSNTGQSPTLVSLISSASSSLLAQASQGSASVAFQKEQMPSPHPPTQESIFKSITRRLSLLEANATLSLQYIESQSALLRSAFAATNAQQLNRTSTFLEKLNATVLTELARAKADYDQLWQSTVLELHGQREEGRKEREILGERVRLLAEEVVGTKRLMAAQATLLLIVLGLVIFTRNAPLPNGEAAGSSVDLRFLSSSVQGLIRHGRSRSNLKDSEGARSTSGQRRRWQWDSMSPWASPSQTRPGTRASGDRDRDGMRLDRRSSDEASQENLALHKSDEFSEKPLPPAPRQESEDEQDHSDSASDRRDTVTLRNYRPNLQSLRIDVANATASIPDGYYGGASPLDDDHYRHGVPNGDGVRTALLRDVQSAPTTPSVESSDPVAPQAGSLSAQLNA